jgi:hypothetical protein
MNTRSDYSMLIEEMRSTGMYGREPKLSAVDPKAGTIIVAIRQLEVCTSQLVPPWLDGRMSNAELFEFMRSNLLERLEAFAVLSHQAFEDYVAEWPALTDEVRLTLQSWRAIQAFILTLRSATDPADEYGAHVLTTLLAVMALRQMVEWLFMAETTANPPRFVLASSNVAESWVTSAITKLGGNPFEAAFRPPLIEMCRKIARCSAIPAVSR